MSSIDYKLIGERIKKIRLDKGISQVEMAQDFGISSVFISRIEKGMGKVNLTRLTQFSDYFEVPLSYFLTGSVEKTENYLNKEFQDVLKKCSPERQREILHIARIIAKI